jgi:hypothetical protein
MARCQCVYSATAETLTKHYHAARGEARVGDLKHLRRVSVGRPTRAAEEKAGRLCVRSSFGSPTASIFREAPASLTTGTRGRTRCARVSSGSASITAGRRSLQRLRCANPDFHAGCHCSSRSPASIDRAGSLHIHCRYISLHRTHSDGFDGSTEFDLSSDGEHRCVRAAVRARRTSAVGTLLVTT